MPVELGRDRGLVRRGGWLVLAPAMALVVTAAVPLVRAVWRFQRCADRMNDGMEQVAGATWDRFSPWAKLALPGEYRKHFGSDRLLEEYHVARRSVVRLGGVLSGAVLLATLIVVVASRLGAGVPR